MIASLLERTQEFHQKKIEEIRQSNLPNKEELIKQQEARMTWGQEKIRTILNSRQTPPG